MPQQPASRSTTFAEGMRLSSDMVAGSSPSDFWWQWPCTRIRLGPASERQVQLRGEFIEQHAGVRYGLRLLLLLAAQERRCVVFEDGQTTRLAEQDLLTALGDREQRFHHLAGLRPSFGQQPLRNQTGVRSSRAGPR